MKWVLGGSDHSKTTTDSLYTITPIGRLINVKIQKVVDDEEYDSLRFSGEVSLGKIRKFEINWNQNRWF